MEKRRTEILNWTESFTLPKEFSDLFNVEKNNKMTLSDIIRHLNKYIRNNDLQDIENGYKINPDSNLQKVLNLKGHDCLNYFNLIEFVKAIFIKY